VNAVMVKRDGIYFDVKVSFVESRENMKEDKKKEKRGKNMQNEDASFSQ